MPVRSGHGYLRLYRLILRIVNGSQDVINEQYRNRRAFATQAQDVDGAGLFLAGKLSVGGVRLWIVVERDGISGT